MRVLCSVVLLFMLALPIAGLSSSEKLWTISANRITIERGEKIVGFQLNIQGGWIESLQSIPEGWHISVSNLQDEVSKANARLKPNYWNTTLDGSADSPAACIGPEFFHDFAYIKRTDLDPKYPKFEAQLIISASKNRQRRKLVIPMSSLDIDPAK